MLGREKLTLYPVLHNAVEELRIFERDRRIQIADVGARGHLGKGIAAHRIARLVTALDVFPKQEAVAEVLIFQNRVGANNGGPHEAATERLRKGRGKEGQNRKMQLFDARKGLTVAGAKLGLRLVRAVLGRRR